MYGSVLPQIESLAGESQDLPVAAGPLVVVAIHSREGQSRQKERCAQPGTTSSPFFG